VTPYVGGFSAWRNRSTSGLKSPPCPDETTHGGQYIAGDLADLASMKCKVRITEREVSADETGKSLKDVCDGLGLRVLRDGTPYGFWRPQVANLQPGDFTMEIKPTTC